MPDVSNFLPCLLLLFLVIGLAVLLIVLPIIQAPSKVQVARAARKRIDWHSDISRNQLKEYLRGRFLPEWAQKAPDGGILPGARYGAGGVAAQFFLEMRWSFATMVIDNRIDAAIDSLMADEGNRESRSRSRRGRRRRS